MRNFRLRFFVVFGLLLSIVSGFTYVSGKYVMTTPSLNLALDVNARFDIGFNPNGGKLNIDEPDESWLDVSEDSLHKVVTNGEVYGAIPTAKKDGYDFVGWSDVSYERLEYLESTGSQYIDTGLKGNQNTAINVKFSSKTINDQTRIFGASQSYSNSTLELYVYQEEWEVNRVNSYDINGTKAYGFGSGKDPIYTYETDLDNPAKMTVTNLQSKEAHTTTYSGNFETPYTISLFSTHRPVGYQSSSTNVRIYEFKLYQNKELLRDYIPVYWYGGVVDVSVNGVITKNSNVINKCGMYDLVNNVLYITPTENDFVRGDSFREDNHQGFIDENTIVRIFEDSATKAIWSPKQYTLTLDYNLPTSKSETITVTYDETYENLPYPNRVGYNFDGWFDSEDETVQYKNTDTVKVLKNKELIAHWSPKQYTITLDATGGSVTPSQMQVTYENVYGDLPTPTRNKYNFLGWYTTKSEKGYGQVAYLESTGSQFIDTGLKGNQDTGVYIKFSTNSDTNENNVYGSAQGYNDRAFELYSWNQQWEVNKNGSYPFITAFAAEGTGTGDEPIYTCKSDLSDLSKFTVTNVTTGQSQTVTTNNNSFTTPGTIYLYGTNRPTKVFAENKIRIYEFKLYNKETLLMDLIPVIWYGGIIKNSINNVVNESYVEEGTLGFYDVVNDVLYLNSNTKDDTPFVSGPYIQAGEEIEVTNTTLVTNPFNHSVYAKWEYAYHNVLYQLDRGEFVASSIEDESWIKTSDKVVTKEYPNNVEYGDLPVAISDGYDFVGWAEDKNADADAKALPTGYSQLEYIEANYENGLNQYIDTGYKPSQDSFGYIIDYIFFNDLNSGTASVMSCYGSWNSSSYCFGLGGNYNREYGAHNMGWIAGEGHSTGVCNTPGERSTISVITKNQKTTTISPLYNKVDETLGSKVSAINIPLFACNAGSMKEFAHTKIYSLKLLEGDEVVRDFVPAMWSGGVTKYSYRGIEYEQELSQGTIGLYDAKNDCFYINSGSDSKPFKGGEEVYPLIKSNDIVSLTKDVTYISIWKNKVFTITLDPNDEVGSTKVIDFTDKTLSVSYLEKYGNKLPKLERQGYTFLGFFDGDNKIEENAIYEYTTNKTLKAKWQANTYKVKLISNCDIELDDDEIEVTFDGKYPELPALSKENFKLDGYRLSLVPSNFREVEYLEGTGSQYIDTGYHPNQATFGYEVDFMFINDLGGTRTCMGIWDAWTSANNTPCFSLGGNYKNYCGGYNYSWIAGDENCSGSHCNYGERVYESVFNDGETITSTSPLLGVTTSKVISNKTAAHKLYIFGNNGGNDGAAGENAHVKFYSIKLYELDKLVYNFVPAIYDGGEITYSYKGNIATGELSKSNVAGFYETVNGVFYINSGTGDFLCGEEVIDEEPIIIKSGDNVSVAYNHSLIANWKPIEYKVRYVYDSSSMYYEDSAIEYIECNADAYAYTNIKCDYKNQIEFELMLTSETDGGVLIGACGQTNAILLGINGDKKLYTIYGDKTQINTSDTPLELNKKYNVKYVSDAGNQYVYINDNAVLQTKIAGTFTPDYNYSLFAYNNMNKTATGNYQDMFKGIVYFCSIKTQGELKAELYPRINPDSNKVGLYDKVTGNFYASSTENEFIAGKKIEGESTDVVKYNEDYTIRKIEDKPKYTPQGWSLKEDLSTLDYEQEQVVKNLSNVDGDVITLYPIYKQTEGYIDIDYVESTPTKSGYCLTNVTQNGNSTITAEIMLLDDNSGGTIVGSTGEKNALSLDIVDKRIVVKYASGTYTSDMELEKNKKYKIELITSSKDATVVVNVYDGETKYDNVINKEGIATFTTTSYNLSLLTFNNKNSYSNTFIGRVYSISISTDGNTKGIYKPVIDVKTSKTYLYDKYNDVPMDIVGEFFSE